VSTHHIAIIHDGEMVTRYCSAVWCYPGCEYNYRAVNPNLNPNSNPNLTDCMGCRYMVTPDPKKRVTGSSNAYYSLTIP